ncbi:hypothetical protein [Paraflavitalea speifideaquila]|uniref:hypothetical protein n=1 Tax=Paraflavitalea speifideaquila TaxID=3076558 RepID=UPI0028E2D426|nr:hypothetical protein [Paraflavitalea speifideiaquila]
MNVYIIKQTPGHPEGADDLVIMKVQPEQEEAFLQEYGSRIIVVGSSIQDVLIKFGQHINDQG